MRVRNQTAGFVHGDAQFRALRAGADVVVATPGRLLDHMNTGLIDFGKVEVMDSCGVELLLRVRETLLDHDGRLCLAGLRGSFRRMLSMMRLTPYFQMAADETEARELLTQPAPDAPTRS